jgi:acetate---CoA ligase (ADP-forming)
MLENELYEWLRSYEIPTAEYRFFPLAGEPDSGFYPVALKIVSQKVVHKTEVGAVLLNLKNRDELIRAKQTILHNLERHGIVPDETDGWIVTRMYTGVELFFGVIQDPVFEKVIVFGAGGIGVELFRDICYIDSEAGEEEIKRAILQTRIGQIFSKGFRGIKYDIHPVVDFVLKLQRLEVRELDCNPVILTDNQLVLVDARVLLEPTVSSVKQLKYIPELFKPESTAIIGVSGDAAKVGYAMAKNSSQDEQCFFVNPHLETLFGKKVFSRIEDLPFIDTAVLCIPASGLQDSIELLIPKKVRNIIIITAGFKESGKDEKYLKELAEKYQVNIIGPNCLGIYANKKNLSFGTGAVKNGEVNLFSQSGAIVAELMDKADNKNIGFENIISAGNMADVDFADLIHSYTGMNSINLYIEGVSNGKNLLRAIRESRSSIRIFKAGKTDAAKKAAFSHTGNLAGNYELFVGLMKSVNARLLPDINGLLYPYHFEKVLIITNAGGVGTVMSDLISEKLYSLSPAEISKLNEILPSNWSKNNPVDIIGDATSERYLRTLRVADSFGVDAIYVLVTPQFMTDTEKISRLFCGHQFKTPMFPVLLGGERMEKAKNLLKEEKIVFFEELTEAVSFL